MKQEKVLDWLLLALKPGDEHNCGDLAILCGCSRKQIIDAADDLADHDFHLHVADGVMGWFAFERPKKSWTLYRDVSI
mgnify:CR=1 FL=1